MRQGIPAQLPRGGTLTRREMVKLLASLGVGASLLASRLAAAAENANKNGTRMVTAIFFESYATVALRRTLRYAGDEGFVASMPQLLHARTSPRLAYRFWPVTKVELAEKSTTKIHTAVTRNTAWVATPAW